MEVLRVVQKPILLHAVEFRGGHEEGSAIVHWIQRHRGSAIWVAALELEGETYLYPEHIEILNHEGVPMRAEVGDFIIQGVHGEFTPCKPDIFWTSYALEADIH